MPLGLQAIEGDLTDEFILAQGRAFKLIPPPNHKKSPDRML